MANAGKRQRRELLGCYKHWPATRVAGGSRTLVEGYLCIRLATCGAVYTSGESCWHPKQRRELLCSCPPLAPAAIAVALLQPAERAAELLCPPVARVVGASSWQRR
jgi:hypothetical protein